MSLGYVAAGSEEQRIRELPLSAPRTHKPRRWEEESGVDEGDPLALWSPDTPSPAQSWAQ